MNRPLLITRISGLPGFSVDSFVSERCWEAVTGWHQCSEELKEVRASLVEALYLNLRDSEPRVRRILLDLKRACFNGRPIEALTRRPEWQDIPRRLGERAEMLLLHEQRLKRADEELHRIHESETTRSTACLLPFLKDLRLLRGISMASSGLIEELERQAQEGSAGRGRKVRKAERSLLRYLTRAALKVSPYSTLTCIGAAALVETPPRGELRLAGPPWHERSLVRARRFLIDQCFIFLAHQAPVRRRLRVCLNTTLERLDGDVFRFLKPMDLLYEESEAKLRLAPPSQVKVRLSGPIIDLLLTDSWDDPPTFAELVSSLAIRCATADDPAEDTEEAEETEEVEESVEATIDQLIRVGFLELRTPWSAYATRIEESLAELLLSLDLDEPLRRAAAALSRLVALEDGFAQSPEPRMSLGAMQDTLNEIWKQIVEANDLRLATTTPFAKPPSLYEDVFLLASGHDGGYGEIFQMPRATAAELLRCGNAIARIFHLFSSRFNFLYSLAVLLRQLNPENPSASFLELFAAAQPLWRDYIASRRRYESRDFNPYSLPEIEELKALRREVHEELDRLRSRCPNPPASAFEAIAASLPSHYDPLVGCSLFVQPVDTQGELWVMNRMLEGTGRFSCRFTTAMPEAMREAFTERFAKASVLHVHGRRVELLDILYGRENTVNQHWPQTPKVLEIPGEWSDLPRDRRLTLSDLRVDLDSETGLPIIRDPRGIQYLPCQMNAVTDAYMPVLLKFLSMFGPLTSSPEIFPSWSACISEGMTVLDRLTFGNLIFRRKRWVVPVSLLPDRNLEPVVYFREIGPRLQSLGIPRQVFWIEFIKTRPADLGDSKPQFLDFASPLLVAAFQDSNKEEPEVTFEEVLPDRSAFPLGADGQRRGIEIILESLLMEKPT